MTEPRVYPIATREGQKTAHLLEEDGYALCGRAPRGHWCHVVEAVEVKNRCGDCDVAARMKNPRPSIPVFPWRVRRALL